MNDKNIKLYTRITALSVVGLMGIAGLLTYQDVLGKIENSNSILSRLEAKISNLAKSNQKSIERVTQKIFEQNALQSASFASREPDNASNNQQEVEAYLNEQYDMIEALRLQMDQLVQQISENDTRWGESVASIDSESLPMTVEDVRQQIAASESAYTEHIQAVELGFQNQVQNEAWAYENNTKVQYALDDLATAEGIGHFDIDNVECKSSTCKIDLLHAADSENIEMVKMELMASLASELKSSTSTVEVNSDGTTRTTYYFSN